MKIEQQDEELTQSVFKGPDDGGPAFPIQTKVVDDGILQVVVQAGAPGMSLRDYFAAQAVAGFLAGKGHELASDEDGPFIAMYAYEIADAMLAERKKPARE